MRRSITARLAGIVKEAARDGHDYGWELGTYEEKLTEAEAAQRAKLDLDWRGWLNREVFRAAVVRLLESRLEGAGIGFDDGLIDYDPLSENLIRFSGEALGASYTLDTDDPYDYVEAPAPADDHSREIAAALEATGADVSVDSKIVNDPRFDDLQHLVFSITARWNLAGFEYAVPPEVNDAFTQGVLTGFREARAA
jgi:hypothetical protein